MQRHFRFAQAPLVGRVESASIVKIPIAANFVRNTKSFRYGTIEKTLANLEDYMLKFLLSPPSPSAAESAIPRVCHPALVVILRYHRQSDLDESQQYRS